MSFKFFFWVLNWRKNKRQEVVDSLEGIDKTKILIFTNRKKLNKWYKASFGQKIIV